MDEHATTEGMRIGIKNLLEESVYAKIILLTVGNSAPHGAVFGRVPPLLQVTMHDPPEA